MRVIECPKCNGELYFDIIKEEVNYDSRNGFATYTYYAQISSRECDEGCPLTEDEITEIAEKFDVDELANDYYSEDD